MYTLAARPHRHRQQKKPRLSSPIVDAVDSTTFVDEGEDVPSRLQESAPQHPQRGGKKASNKKFKKPPPPEPGSADDVSWFDIAALLGKDAVDAATAAGSDYESPVTFGDELELTVDVLSSNGAPSVS